MATYTIRINEKTKSGKNLAAFLRSSKDVLSFESKKDPDLEEALEDAREGRVFEVSSGADLIKSAFPDVRCKSHQPFLKGR
jgi:hypothetical protein